MLYQYSFTGGTIFTEIAGPFHPRHQTRVWVAVERM